MSSILLRPIRLYSELCNTRQLSTSAVYFAHLRVSNRNGRRFQGHDAQAALALVFCVYVWMVTVGFQAYVEEAPSALNHRPYHSLQFFNQYSADIDCVNGTSSFQVPTSVINARNWHVVADEHTESEAIALETSFCLSFLLRGPLQRITLLSLVTRSSGFLGPRVNIWR
ncbi:hypothetical protein BC629DRAFT_474375 [Irpex lacteus]|nr:hypothetical protein BC629DRAFT_474375 [Irpex lacteus]